MIVSTPIVVTMIPGCKPTPWLEPLKDIKLKKMVKISTVGEFFLSCSLLFKRATTSIKNIIFLGLNLILTDFVLLFSRQFSY